MVRLTDSCPVDCIEGSSPSCYIALRTFSLVSRLIDGLFLHTLEAVEGETPASAATSFKVTGINMRPFCLKLFTIIIMLFYAKVNEIAEIL